MHTRTYTDTHICTHIDTAQTHNKKHIFKLIYRTRRIFSTYPLKLLEETVRQLLGVRLVGKREVAYAVFNHIAATNTKRYACQHTLTLTQLMQQQMSIKREQRWTPLYSTWVAHARLHTWRRKLT